MRRPQGSNMPGIQPPLWPLLNICCRSLFSICTLLLYRLAPCHLYSVVLMNLLHHFLNLICIQTLLITFHCRFPFKLHSGICTFNQPEHCVLCWFRNPIIHGELSQARPIHWIILLMFNKHQKIMFHTGIHSVHLTVHLRVMCSWHPSINYLTATYLAAKGWGKLWCSIRDNCQWKPMEGYYLLEKQQHQPYCIVSSLTRDQMSHLQKSVHWYPYGIEPFALPQSNIKIHRNIFPWFLQYWQGAKDCK